MDKKKEKNATESARRTVNGSVTRSFFGGVLFLFFPIYQIHTHMRPSTRTVTRMYANSLFLCVCVCLLFC